MCLEVLDNKATEEGSPALSLSLVKSLACCTQSIETLAGAWMGLQC